VNEQLEQVKRMQIINVLERITTSSVTKKKACEDYGISVSTFDRAVAEDPELMGQFVLARRVLVQQRYEDIVAAEDQVIRSSLDAMLNSIEKIMEKAELENDPLVALSIYERALALADRVTALRKTTEIELGLIGGVEEEGKSKLLLGADLVPAIALRPGKQRVMQRETITQREIIMELSDPSQEKTQDDQQSRNPNIVDGSVLPD
jgi:hypothetical protein